MTNPGSRRFFAILVMLMAVLNCASPGAANESAAVDVAGGADNYIHVTLRADTAPEPGGVTTLTIEARPLIDAPDLVINWVLPEGAELIGDPVDHLGAVAAGQTATAERQVRFPMEGTFKVAVNAGYSPLPDAEFGASGVLFFVVENERPRASDRDPDARHPHRTIMPAEVNQEPLLVVEPDAMAPTSPDGDPCFTVRGRLVRTDRRNAPGGRVVTTNVPVHNARMEIRESDTLFDDSYGTALTDANGDYSRSFCDDDGWFDDELEIYVRLRAELWLSGEKVVEVEDSSWIDEVYEFNTSTRESEGGTLTFNVTLNEGQSEIFNIADAAFDAYKFWNDSGGEDGGDDIFDDEAEIHWEPGYGDSGSYFQPFWNEITIADDPSDPDMWDDSVIIHEWGHMADDYYSCDDNPGGQHFVDQLVTDPELSWGEGYPDYYQSAARAATGDPDASRYMDFNGAGMPGINLNLETWDVDRPTLISVLNEFAIAAALWDLNDAVNDGQDMVAHGHAPVQKVYTSEAFEDEAYGFWDDTCTFRTYIRSWVADGQPADTQTAAAVEQNTGVANLGTLVTTQSGESVQAPMLVPQSTDYKWWNQLAWVIDNSLSMSGPKFNAVKTVMQEQLNDLAQEPEGTEFNLDIFNNSSNTNTQVFANQFFPNRITDDIAALGTSGAADPNCPVRALDALSEAIEGEYDMDAWLFTDGDTTQTPSVESLRQLLLDRDIRASFAVMGLCPPSAAVAPTEDMDESVQAPPVAGALASLLGANAAMGLNETPGGVVPYLLTAIGSGGQFLFVPSDNVNNAADILRAQITNSAGAGKWSDYVSHEPTYRYDTLATWEYEWIEAHTSAGGTSRGQPELQPSRFLQIPLPSAFTFYGRLPSNGIRVYENGHITFNSFAGNPGGVNTPLPSASAPLRALFPMWDDLGYVVICRDGTNAPEGCGPESGIFTKMSDDGEWFVTEWYNYYSSQASFFSFQVLLNMESGEIRYQYAPSMAANAEGSATIGLQDTTTNALQVSYNDVNAVDGGEGFKFTPVPPQPSKTYSVTVDSTMQSVGYLLTGYSGSFEPLDIRTPAGTAISCASSGVYCLSMEGSRIQYVQVDVQGRHGNWTATVEAPPGSSGTFSFSSFAASPIAPESLGDRIRPIGASGPIFVQVGQPIDDNVLTGWFRGPDDSPFGAPFTLYDDGAHDDALAGDGLFGSNDYTPSGEGTGYLWLQGSISDTTFVRMDPAPYTFQPIRVTSLGDRANTGTTTALPFEAENLDDHDHCYWVQRRAPEGWTTSYGSFLPIICLDAGETATFNVQVSMGGGTPNPHPSGTSGQVTVSLIEIEKGIMTESASATVTRHRAASTIDIHNPTFYVEPNGGTTEIEFHVLDAQGFPVADGTTLNLSASSGSISPASAPTVNGIVRATFTSGPAGQATITAQSGSATATTTVDVGAYLPSQIELSVSGSILPNDGRATSQLTVIVRDREGTPMPNQRVRVGVTGDTQMGTIQGGEVVEGMTNAQGRFTATYTAGHLAGVTRVRAELLYDKGDGQGLQVVHEATAQITLQGSRVLYLPNMRR